MGSAATMDAFNLGIVRDAVFETPTPPVTPEGERVYNAARGILNRAGDIVALFERSTYRVRQVSPDMLEKALDEFQADLAAEVLRLKNAKTEQVAARAAHEKSLKQTNKRGKRKRSK